MIIETEQSEMATNIVFFPELDRKLLFCIGYRTLWAVEKWDLNLVQLISEHFNSHAEPAVLIKLDTKSDFLVNGIKETDCDETAINSDHRFYRLMNMSLDICDKPDTFQPTTNVMLSTVK